MDHINACFEEASNSKEMETEDTLGKVNGFTQVEPNNNFVASIPGLERANPHSEVDKNISKSKELKTDREDVINENSNYFSANMEKDGDVK